MVRSRSNTYTATVKGLKYIIMLDTVDNEKDINILTVSDYYSQFEN